MNNRVMQEDGSAVRKVFRDRISFEKELEIYRMLGRTGLIPALYESAAKSLLLEKVEGETLSDLLGTPENAGGGTARVQVQVPVTMPVPVTVLAAQLAEWMLAFQDAFHEKTGGWMVHEDLNPRNLLVTDGTARIRGIDFEYWHTGSREEALAVLPAMLGTLDPAGGMGEQLAESVYGVLCSTADRDLLDRYVKEQKQAILLRRSAMREIRSSTCGILAGGKGSRMGGVNKGGLIYKGYSFLEHILHTVQCFDRIIISTATGRDTESDPALSPYPEVADLHAGAGPMGGLEALLTACETDTLMIVPCDTPLIGRGIIYRLFSEMEDDCDAVVLRCNGRVYPTIGIYRKRILPVAQEAVAGGDLRMMSLLDRIHVRYVDTDDAREVQNINTPEDLEQLSGGRKCNT